MYVEIQQAQMFQRQEYADRHQECAHHKAAAILRLEHFQEADNDEHGWPKTQHVEGFENVHVIDQCQDTEQNDDGAQYDPALTVMLTHFHYSVFDFLI